MVAASSEVAIEMDYIIASNNTATEIFKIYGNNSIGNAIFTNSEIRNNDMKLCNSNDILCLFVSFKILDMFTLIAMILNRYMDHVLIMGETIGIYKK